MNRIAILLLALLAMGACSGDGVGQGTPGTGAPTTAVAGPMESSSTSVAGSVAATSLAPTTEAPAHDVLQELGLVYHTDAEGEWTVRVFYPAGEGRWPLIVIVPPQQNVAYAGFELASRGAVVVVAEAWSKRVFADASLVFSGEMDRAACIVGWAQAHAAEYGGDSELTVVDGYSAGAVAAAWVGLGLADDTVCEYPIMDLPVGLVVGENQVLFHHDRWDVAFGTDAPGVSATLDGLINPDRWNVSPELQVALWSAENPFGEVRSVENPPGPDSWIWLRDAASPCVEDLTAVGAFDDGQIDWSDNARLLEQRLGEAGIDVRNETYPISHVYTTEVYDLIFSILP
jgi:hypothetical protein